MTTTAADITVTVNSDTTTFAGLANVRRDDHPTPAEIAGYIRSVLGPAPGNAHVRVVAEAEDFALIARALGGYDVVMLDTAGRVTLDEALMAEVAEVKAVTRPHEVLLVADSLTGQDAVNLARAFDERVGLTGIVLTRVDGDGLVRGEPEALEGERFAVTTGRVDPA